MSSLGAFIETLKIYEKEPVVEHLWRYGKDLKLKVNQIAKSLGIDKHFFFYGPAIALNYITKNQNQEIEISEQLLERINQI